jgi:hypothetical protein
MQIIRLFIIFILLATYAHATVAPTPALFDGGTGSEGTLYAEATGGSTTSTTCPISDPCTHGRAQSLALPGYKIIYRCGNYSITKITTVVSGAPGRHIIYQSETPQCAVFDASYNHMLVIRHSYLTFDNLKFVDTKAGFPTAADPGSAISIVKVDPATGSHHIIIENNWFYRAGNYAIQALGETVGNNNIIIRNNKFEGTGYIADHIGDVIVLGRTSPTMPGAQDVFIYGNEIFDFTGNALDTRLNTTGVWFFGNVMYDYDTPANHGVTTANAIRDGVVRLEGAAGYAYDNVFRDAPNAPVLGFGMRQGRTTTQPNLVYNNVIDTTTTQDPTFCISGTGAGSVSSYFNNTHWALTDYDSDTTNCAYNVVRNNIGIQAVANNLADSAYDATYFTDAAGGDFTLTALATGAIDAVTGEPFSETDFDGASIQGTARDYGAFESGETTPPPPPPSTSFPTTAVLDNFNRADISPIGSPWAGGVIGVGTCQIITNTLRAGTGTQDCYYNVSYGTTQEAYLTLPNATNHGDLHNFRLHGCLQGGIGTAGVDGYSARFQKRTTDVDILRIERMDNTTAVSLAVTNLEMLNGAKLGLQILNTGVINLWVDVGAGWVQQLTATDPTPLDCTGTRIGVGIYNPASHVDDFGGGAQSASGGGAGNPLLAVPIFYD